MSTLLIFLLLLSVLVLVHEWGHFMAARLLGIKVEEFGFGLPFTPPVFKIKNKKSGTQYAIYPLLFGGFVRLYGEEKDVSIDRDKSFWARGKRQRIGVIVAGVIMNMVLALGLFVVLYGVLGVPKSVHNEVTLVGVSSGSPAAKAGLQVGDRIVAVEGKAVGSLDEFSQLMKSWGGIGVNITFERGQGTDLFEGIVDQGGVKKVVNMVPRLNPPAREGALGVIIASYPYLETDKCSMWNAACSLAAVKQGFASTGLWIGRVFDGLRSIAKSLFAGQVPQGVLGPVGIYQLTGIIAAEGVWPLVEFTAILSVNLAVFNILPIPALDGGRLIFVVWELVTRKRINQELEEKVNAWGMAFLLGLIVLISIQDVLKLDFFVKLFKH